MARAEKFKARKQGKKSKILSKISRHDRRQDFKVASAHQRVRRAPTPGRRPGCRRSSWRGRRAGACWGSTAPSAPPRAPPAAGSPPPRRREALWGRGQAWEEVQDMITLRGRLPPGGQVAGGVPPALELRQARAAAVGAVTVHRAVPVQQIKEIQRNINPCRPTSWCGRGRRWRRRCRRRACGGWGRSPSARRSSSGCASWGGKG